MTMAGTSDFLALVRQRERGKLKVYIGSAAGTGKTYRMLQEAHDLRRRGIDVVVGFVETHGRAETVAQIGDLEIVPRKKIEYRGVTLEEMDVDAVIARRPQVAIVDELAHTNVPGARNGKRWEDVIAAARRRHQRHLRRQRPAPRVAERRHRSATLGVTVRETVPGLGRRDRPTRSSTSTSRPRISASACAKGRSIAPTRSTRRSRTSSPTRISRRCASSRCARSRAPSIARARRSCGARRAAARAAPPHASTASWSCHVEQIRRYTATLLRKAQPHRRPAQLRLVSASTSRRPDERPDRIDSTVQRKLVDNIQLAQSLGAEVVKLDGAGRRAGDRPIRRASEA